LLNQKSHQEKESDFEAQERSRVEKIRLRTPLVLAQRDDRARAQYGQSLFRINQVYFEGLAELKLIRLSVREN